MDDLSKRRKWRRWLGRIATEVHHLQREHSRYLELREHLAGNAEWVSFIDSLYLVGVSIALRRLADANPRHRTVSLVKLLRDMEAHAECLSRRSLLQSVGAARRDQMNRFIRTIAGDTAPHLPQPVIRQWLAEFERAAAPFRAWVDHRVAHHDLTVRARPPESQHVDEALNVASRLVTILQLLLEAKGDTKKA